MWKKSKEKKDGGGQGDQEEGEDDGDKMIVGYEKIGEDDCG